MPYALRTIGGRFSGSYVALDSPIAIGANDDFSIFIEATPAESVDHWRILGGTSDATDRPRLIVFGDGRFWLDSDNVSGARTAWSTGLDLTTVKTLEIRRVSGRTDLYINGAIQSGGNTNTSSYLGFQRFNINFNTRSAANVDYRRIRFEINGAVVHDYNKQALDGSDDTVFPDVVGGNDGTLFNALSDNSQWVYYDDGTSEPEPVVQTITVSDAVQQDEVELINSTQLIALDVMSAQQIDKISLVDTEIEQAIAVPDAVQVDSYELISTSISSLIDIQNAVQQDESALISIEQLGSQTLSIFSATQIDEASVIDINLLSNTEIANGIQQDVSNLIDTSMVLETLIYSAVQQDTASLILVTQPAEYRDLSALSFLPINNDLSLTPMSTIVQLIETVEDITHTIQKV